MATSISRLFVLVLALPASACTMVEVNVWSDEGGVIEVSGAAVTNSCDIWQASGVMQTDCPVDAAGGYASWSGSTATTGLYSLKAIPNSGYTFAGWNGCDFTGTDGYITWKAYTSADGSTCHFDHGGNYGSYTLKLAQSESLADVSAKFNPVP